MAHNHQQMPQLDYLPSYNQTRAPPSGAPPAYANVIRKVYTRSMRPVVMVTSFFTFLYVLLVAISNLKKIDDQGNTTSMKLFDVLIGALLLAVAVVEVLGFVGAFRSNLKLALLYSKLTVPGLAVVIAAEILGVVGHYKFKGSIIDKCVTNNTGTVASSGGFFGGSFGNSSNTVMSQADAQSYCNSQWRYDSNWEIVWLVITLLVGIPFVLFSFAYVRELRDPSRVTESSGGWFGRRNQAPSAQFGHQGPYDPQAQAYPMNAYPPAPYGAYAPPPGPPPQQQADYNRDLPKYDRGAMEDDFDDRKSPISPVGYSYGAGLGRASSSRDRDPRHLDAAKDSQVTVKLDDDDSKIGKSKANPFQHDDDDDAPRI